MCRPDNIQTKDSSAFCIAWQGGFTYSGVISGGLLGALTNHTHTIVDDDAAPGALGLEKASDAAGPRPG